MRLKILGSAAGGGFPQWNCHCRVCQGQRQGSMQAQARSQSSLAIATEDERWVLVNASPDVRQQLETLPRPAQAAVRWSPVAAVILTDSQIDHATGLLFLREARAALPVYCTAAVYQDLIGPFPVLTMLGAYAGVERHALVLGGEGFTMPQLPGIRLVALPLGGKSPPYSPQRGQESADANVALAMTNLQTGRSVLYAPALSQITPQLEPYLAASDVLLLDGTCWHDDDMQRAGAGTRRARDMGHWPLAGEDGLLAKLAEFPKARKVLVHINNTNPLLDDCSPERAMLAACGVELGCDGMELEL